MPAKNPYAPNSWEPPRNPYAPNPWTPPDSLPTFATAEEESVEQPDREDVKRIRMGKRKLRLLEKDRLKAERKLGYPVEAPGPPESLASKIITNQSRINYGEAAAFDAALKGKPAMAAGIAEFAKPTAKQTFGDVLGEHFPEADVTVSDVAPFLFNETGKGWQLKKDANPVDIGLRGTMGFGMDVAGDPLTYTTFGVGGLVGSGARTVTRKGAVYLTKQGIKTVNMEAAKEMPRALRLANYLSRKNRLTEIDPKFLGHARSAEMVAREIARRRAVERVVKAGERGMIDPGGIKFAGKVIVPGEKFRPLATGATRLARSIEAVPAGRVIMEGLRTPGQVYNQMFRATRSQAARVPRFLEEKARFLGRKRQLATDTSALVNDWEKTIKLNPRTRDGTMSTDRYLHLHRDNPLRYPVDNLPPAVREMLPTIKGAYDETWAISRDLNMIGPEAYRANYQPRLYRNPIEEMEDLSTRFKGPLPTGAIGWAARMGKHAEERVFATLDDAKDYAAKLKAEGSITWDLKPVESFTETSRAYFAQWGDALAAQEFTMRAKRHLGVSPERVAKETFDHAFPGIRERLTAFEAASSRSVGTPVIGEPGPLTEMMEQVGNLLSYAHDDVNKAAARTLGSQGQALYWLGRLRQTASMKELQSYLNDPHFMEVDQNLINSIRDIIDDSQRQVVNKWNTPYATVRLELGKYGTKDETWWLPEDIAQELVRAQTTGEIPLDKHPELRKLLKTFDAATTVGKGFVTAWPSYLTRNGYNNVFQTMADIGISALNPRRVGEVAKIMLGHEGTFVTPTGRYTYNELREMAKRSIFSEIRSLHELPTNASMADKLLRLPHVRAVHQANVGLENSSKMLHYVAQLERGLDPDQAALKVQQFLFDYDDLAPADKLITKRLFLFPTWARKNLELQIQLLKHKPGVVLAGEKLGDRDRGPERDALPSYLAGDFKIKLVRDGKVQYVHGLDMPFRNAMDLIFDGGMLSTLQRHAGQLNVFMRTLGETVTQVEWYSGRDFPDRETLDSVFAVLGKMPPWAREWIDVRTDVDEETGEKRVSMNGTKFYLLFKGFWVSRVQGAMRRAEREPGLSRAIVDFLSGAKLKEFDMTELERRIIENKVKRLDEKLQRVGGRYKYDRTAPVE